MTTEQALAELAEHRLILSQQRKINATGQRYQRMLWLWQIIMNNEKGAQNHEQAS